jgi:CBS domain-containing protein
MVERKRGKSSSDAGVRRVSTRESLVGALELSGFRASTCRLVLIRCVELLGANTGSIFLLEPNRRWLRGAYGIWDWTRTSFRVCLTDWPNVERALAENRPLRIGPKEAAGLECDWFEPRGVQCSFAIPMVGHQPVGVLFIDSGAARRSTPEAELDFLHAVASSWAKGIETGVAESADGWPARGMLLGPEIPESAAPRSSDDRLVAELMSRSPVLIDPWVPAHVAQRIAHAASVHHLLAVEDGQMRGVLCLCDLRNARPDTPVADLMHTDYVQVAPHLTARIAARTMLDRSIGCLPVLDATARLVGVITRRDLRQAGVLPGEPGLDACASCGSTHDLKPASSRDSPVFCSECTEYPESDSALEALYYTLGGSE